MIKMIKGFPCFDFFIVKIQDSKYFLSSEMFIIHAVVTSLHLDLFYRITVKIRMVKISIRYFREYIYIYIRTNIEHIACTLKIYARILSAFTQ